MRVSRVLKVSDVPRNSCCMVANSAKTWGRGSSVEFTRGKYNTAMRRSSAYVGQMQNLAERTAARMASSDPGEGLQTGLPRAT